MKRIDDADGASRHLLRGVLRCIRVALALTVTISAALLGVVAAGAISGSWRLLPVRTGSMTPHAPQGSVVIVHPMPVSQLRTGQVIVFRAPVAGHPMVVHRIYALKHTPGGLVVRTKGDANAGPDPWQFQIRGRTVWRGGMVVPELGNALFLLETPHARTVALGVAVASLTTMGLAAIWASGLLAPIVWHAPEAPLTPISWRAEPRQGWRDRRRQWQMARRARRDARRSHRLPSAPRSHRRPERVAGLVATVTVGVAATVGSGAFALFTGPASATATYSSNQLAAPTSLTASVSGSGATASVTLNWTATTSTWATGTRGFRGTVSGGPYSQVAQVTPRTTTSVANTPGEGGVFYYVAEAYYSGNGANWTSANSNQATATVPYTAYIGNYGSNTITPINTSTNAAASTIADSAPAAIAITPDGKTAYVNNYSSATVTPITLATKTAGTAIAVGTNPYAIAITPDGTTAYVTNYGSNTVTPITIATNTAGTAIAVGNQPDAVVITPDGTKAYVANHGSNTVTPITLATKTAGTAIAVGTGPDAIAVTPNGATVYVGNYGSGTITPITVATNTAGTAFAVPGPSAIAITSDGTTAWVANYDTAKVTPVTLATKALGTALTVGTNPYAIAITPDGVTAYVTNYGSANVTPITLATKTAGTAIAVGTSPDAVAIK